MAEAGRIAVVGSVNVDTTFHLPHIPAAGETVLSFEQLVSPGGKGANQAMAATVTGGDVRFIGAIGADAAGELATANLRASGVDPSGIRRVAERPTGTAVVLVAADAENLIVVDPGANAQLDGAHVAAELEAYRPTVVLTQLEIPFAVTEICAAYADAKWRILNPAPIPHGVRIESLLSSFNVLIPNRSELAQLAGYDEPRTIADVAACVTALPFDGVVIVTLGADGAAIFATPSATPTVIAPPLVQPIDTSGAGDVFCGVFASQLGAEEDIHSAVDEAVRMSALSTERRGAQLTSGVTLSKQSSSRAELKMCGD